MADNITATMTTLMISLMTENVNGTMAIPVQPPAYVDKMKQANKFVQSFILAFIMLSMGCMMNFKDIKATVSLK